jgi:hypothetical protein
MKRDIALRNLGLSDQDWGPCYGDQFTHEEFANGWRGTVDCPSEESISANSGLPIDEVKIAKLSEINEKFEAAANMLTVGYPEAEQKTWMDQKIEATSWHANAAAPTPYIDSLAYHRGISREVYLQKTYAKVIAYTAAAQYLVGTRQKYVDMVSSAYANEDAESINSIVVSFAGG